MTRSGDPRVAVVLCGDAVRVASALPVAGLLVSGRIRRMPSLRNIANLLPQWHRDGALCVAQAEACSRCIACHMRSATQTAKWQERPTHTNSNQLTHGSVQPRRRTSSQPLLTVLQATSHAPCSALPISDSRFPIPAMRAAPHILSRVPCVIGCRHSVKECRRVSSLYFLSTPQLPQELHEHRTACRNRPGHGRPG